MLAFTFPGQGSQTPGMGQAWVDHESWELVEEASEISGRDVGTLLLNADKADLRHTHNSQLTTFVLSLVMLDAAERTGAAPAFVAGHSLGEYTALCACGVLSFEDAVRLVCARGDAMQAAAKQQPGAMAAVIGIDDNLVVEVCEQTEGDVWAANFNAPGQVVIAGTQDALAKASEAAKEAGAKRVMGLAVSGAFHTPYMEPAQEHLRAALNAVAIHTPAVPVIANVDATAYETADVWEELLVSQLTSAVRWRASLHTLEEAGVSTFVELGPGKALTGMVSRTVPAATALSISQPSDIDKLLSALAAIPSTGALELGGENLYVTERLIVSPCAGVFKPNEEVQPNTVLDVGDVVGWVADEEVRSPFAGTVLGVMAADGERVTARQSIAWLRAK